MYLWPRPSCHEPIFVSGHAALQLHVTPLFCSFRYQPDQCKDSKDTGEWESNSKFAFLNPPPLPTAKTSLTVSSCMVLISK